jgi:predicted PurR-regulated permease PerM
MKWKQEADLFDCRNRFWYTEVATCSKDIVILMDNSGSMTGYRNTIAKLTVSNILDTLTNNDFVNVYKYSGGVDEVVSCFEDRLVQVRQQFLSTITSSFDDITRYKVSPYFVLVLGFFLKHHHQIVKDLGPFVDPFHPEVSVSL